MLHSTSVCFILRLHCFTHLTMVSKVQYKQLVYTNDEYTRIRKMIRKRIAVRRTISLRIVTSAIALILILLWVISGGLKYARETGRETTKNSTQFQIEVATVLFGLLLLIIGITIVADLALGLSDRLQPREDIANNQGSSKMDNEASREMKTTCKVIARMFGTTVSLFMLLWTIYTGIRLTTEPRRDSKYNHLALSIGVITIAFGLVYFIIGLAIAKDLALDLSGRLQRRKKGNRHSLREDQLC